MLKALFILSMITKSLHLLQQRPFFRGLALLPNPKYLFLQIQQIFPFTFSIIPVYFNSFYYDFLTTITYF